MQLTWPSTASVVRRICRGVGLQGLFWLQGRDCGWCRADLMNAQMFVDLNGSPGSVVCKNDEIPEKLRQFLQDVVDSSMSDRDNPAVIGVNAWCNSNSSSGPSMVGDLRGSL